MADRLKFSDWLAELLARFGILQRIFKRGCGCPDTSSRQTQPLVPQIGVNCLPTGVNSSEHGRRRYFDVAVKYLGRTDRALAQGVYFAHLDPRELRVDEKVGYALLFLASRGGSGHQEAIITDVHS